MVGRGHGELERRGVARLEPGQVSATPARVLRVIVEIRLLRQVVRLDRQG